MDQNDDTNEPKLSFVDDPDRTGKIFPFDSLLDYIRRSNYTTILFASNCAAVLLLKGGITAHSMFKISPATICNVTPRSSIETLLEKATLHVWKACSMISKYRFESFDCTFCDILKLDVSFGGRMVVYRGNFLSIPANYSESKPI